ncbi:MAG: hypothetical protein OEZ55_11175, partial [Nitrospinota bacterium]|nr:hypothetical protein [Nitrospinota bacterium]
MRGEFSEEVRMALAAARERAKSLGAEKCGLKILFLVLLENLDEISYQGLERLGMDPEMLEHVDHGSHGSDEGKWLVGPPLEDKVKRSLDFAMEEAGGRKVFPSHVLLGVLRAMEEYGESYARNLSPSITYEKLKNATSRINGELSQVLEHFS